MNNFLSFLQKNKILISDGAMGTQLQIKGLSTGSCPEEYNITHPEIIKSIYKEYYDSGSDIVTTNTFGGNRIRLKTFNFEDRVKEFNTAAVSLAKDVKPEAKFIAGSIGPIGELLEPFGAVTEEEAYYAFAEQAKILEEAGADVIFIETMMALEEMSAALKAVKENTSLPVSTAMTFEKTPGGFKTQWGVDIETAVKTLESLGADILGSNCGRGFDEMVGVVKEIKLYTNKLILAQANAGIPQLLNGVLVYNETPEIISPKVEELIKAGVNIIGGCCGTTPEHIKIIHQNVNRFSSLNI